MKLLISIASLFLMSCALDVHEQSFQQLDSTHTGIGFYNNLVDTDSFNILEYLYFYNGGGVAAGDINNDGLPDLYFASNQGVDKLYINKGKVQFEEAIHLFDTEDLKGWSTGVNMVDINGDGWLDIYVSRLGDYRHVKDNNKLFINQAGKGFVEKAAEYGLGFSGFSTHSAFFDYDRDGDLDCYLLNHSVKDSEVFKESSIRMLSDSLAGDRLLENMGGHFIDVTAQAGIFSSAVGFGLAVNAADVNGDGWQDIYVGNDFHEQDYLYLNNGDKTFEEVISLATGHTSNFTMGTAIADVNNDLKLDILTLDMKPMDDEIYKKSGGWENMQIYNYKRSFGYHHQSPRNALQVNMGLKNGIPQFSEIAAYHGLDATDWSWSPLVCDIDNDGDKDIFIANGIVRRPNDMDFINFVFNDSKASTNEKLQLIPTGLVENVLFTNDKNSQQYIRSYIGGPTASTGAVIADLDMDGKLDVVTNNINAPAIILHNTSKSSNHYLRVRLESSFENRNAIGAQLFLYSSGISQMQVIGNAMGFQSSSEHIAHFGLKDENVDSLIIRWPNGQYQREVSLALDTLISIRQNESLHDFIASSDTHLIVKNIRGYKHQYEAFSGQQSDKWSLFNEDSKAASFYLEDGKLLLHSEQYNTLGHLNVEDEEFSEFQAKTSLVPDQILKDLGGDLISVFSKCHSLDDLQSYFVSTQNSDYIYHLSNSVKDSLLLDISGKVTSAQWSDLDDDGDFDLVVAGLWMPITVYERGDSGYGKIEISDSEGLWQELVVADINKDGKKDLVVGNFGTNHALHATKEAPLRYYENDFDKNGTKERLVTYVSNSKEVPYVNQSLFVSQLPYAKKTFLSNALYAASDINDIFSKKQIEESITGKVVELKSCVFFQINETWEKRPMPERCQQSPIFAMAVDDDGLVYGGGNLYDVDPSLGRQDAGFLSCFYFDKETDMLVDYWGHLPLIREEIRDIVIVGRKLWLSIRGDSLKVVYFQE